MDRLGSFEFEGVTYPTLASARAILAYCDRTGLKVETVFETYDGTDVEQNIFLLSELLKAGYKWQIRNGGEATPPPSFDDLMDFIDLMAMPTVTFCVLDTMTKGLYTKMRTKNGEASPAEKTTENN